MPARARLLPPPLRSRGSCGACAAPLRHEGLVLVLLQRAFGSRGPLREQRPRGDTERLVP